MSATSTRNKHSKIHGNEKVDITKDEFARMRLALQDEEFRKLFFDYVDEIQDPENRKIYEQEITQLEKERGVDVTFIHPKPGFVVKTAIDGELKCFINICGSQIVERPNNEVAINSETGERGLTWSIPMAQAPARDDIDANKKLCKVFDVVFHPDALHLGTRNSQFRKCLIDTALDGVEREFNVNLDRANLKYPKLDYKGEPHATVIRKLSKNATAEEREPHPLEHTYPKKPEANAGKPKVLPMKKNVTSTPTFAVPKYSIKHSHDIDMAQYTDELDAKLQVTIPRALIVEIELPLLSSTADCQLDVTEKSVYLLSERSGAKYRLKLDLPYTVDDKSGNARFDTEHRRLCITLPVVRSSAREQRQMHDNVRILSREDSGVELNSNSESPAEDEEAGSEAIVELTTMQQTQTDNFDAFPPRQSFLKRDLHYQMVANFDCNIVENVMAFLLHVPNVQPDSMRTVIREGRSVHLQFASMGSGYYPTNYAFLVQLPDAADPQLHIDHVEPDASDDNVVLRLFMSESCMTLPSYLAGPDATDLTEYACFPPCKTNIEDENCDLELDKPLRISTYHNELNKSIEVTIIPQDISEQVHQEQQQEEEEEEEQHEQQQHQHKKGNKKQRKRNKKQRSLSESAFEDLKAEQQQQHQKQQQQQEKLPENSSPESLNAGSSEPVATLKLPQRKQRSFSECNDSSSVQRGILKRFSRYGPRPSISESSSSIDDCSSSYSCSVDAAGIGFSHSFGGIPEERVIADAELSESCKKTVRFNDHIMKKMFRLDSSILGQRKKNQKRRDCKLRAQQRRVSEGDSVDYEEVEHASNGQQTANKTAANAQYFKQPQNNNNRSYSKNNKNQSLHDSGLDLTNNNNHNNEEDTKRNEADAKNAMIFEMDDDDDEDM
ncbi:protein kintoun [Drosophila grimshawi]|uniref:Protein kintoun n=1 Tax=Drosophila grimshawi TaxID=7222 RepID=KTU_DROGR|nr:protein kintoun [Drosophila grimshawi]XP_032591290.1 protein kintoun [Drosophila grimshawi]B4J4Y2.1 RecName: Full=Protein kintoun; AltName: Full=Dynein assembly factor 2, axonemal homolog; AltName: Full=PP1-interacting protein 20 [Drosophila grimshawi]EDW01688.1 GH21580 [Drosophila grimshawi]